MPYKIHIKLNTDDELNSEGAVLLREELRDTAEILLGYYDAVEKFYAVPAGERTVAMHQLLDRRKSKVQAWIAKHAIL